MPPEAEAWHDFYVMVGGAAAALAGLILVALSLHLKAILGHPLYRDRSWSSLQGLVTALLVSAAMLVPQSLTALGVEVSLLAAFWLTRFVQFIRLFFGVDPRSRSPRGVNRRGAWTFEWIAWFAWFLAIAAGGVLLLLADARGLYLLAFGMAATFVLIVWNVWVLMAEVAE